jgi:hypothetical protein
MTRCPRCGYQETEHSECMEEWPPSDQKTPLCDWVLTGTGLMAMLIKAENTLRQSNVPIEYYYEE